MTIKVVLEIDENAITPCKCAVCRQHVHMLDFKLLSGNLSGYMLIDLYESESESRESTRRMSAHECHSTKQAGRNRYDLNSTLPGPGRDGH